MQLHSQHKNMFAEGSRKTKCVYAVLKDEKLHYETCDQDAENLDDHDVRLKVCAVGIRNLNVKMLKFLTPTSESRRYPACQDVCGEVTEIGAAVKRFNVGDTVVGVLPLTSGRTACADQCIMHELDIVKVPSARRLAEAAACVGGAIRAYTALHYLGRLCAGDTVLIMSGASADGLAAIQLALAWGAKVMATVSSEDERVYLEKLQPEIAQLVDIGSKNCSLVSVVLEETGGLGVDIIIDDGVRLFPSEDSTHHILAQKHDTISCLAANGCWITSQPDLQLDPPDSQMLQLRNASVCLLNEQIWTMSRSQQGRYLHVLSDIMDKLAAGILRPNITRTVQFADAETQLPNLSLRLGSAVMHMN